MSASNTTTTVLSVVGSLLGAALVIWPAAVWYEVRKCEKPKYKQLLVLGAKPRAFYDRAPALEVREYSPFVIAEVTVHEKDMREALSKGFRQVAGFIFGGNTKKDKIAMTSPVITETDQGKGADANGSKGSEKIAMTSPVTTEMLDGRYKVAFVMPSKYKSKADLPTPSNPAIELKEIPAHTLAALTWRGWPRPTKEVVQKKEAELRKALEGAGIHVEDNATTRLYQYYPPFAPAPIRLQDVLLHVKRETLPSSAKTKQT